MTKVTFPDLKKPEDEIFCSIGFPNLLAGVTVDSCVVSIEMAKGEDPDKDSMLNGPPVINDAPLVVIDPETGEDVTVGIGLAVTQMIVDGVATNPATPTQYRISYLVTFSNGETKSYDVYLTMTQTFPI